jgi:hypothetical protein
MYLKRLAFMLLALGSSRALAEAPVSVGAAVTPAPALSVQYSASADTGYHLTTSYAGDSARASADYQRFFMPSFGYGRDYRLSFYSGVGLVGQSEREEDVAEEYLMHFPLGAQCALSDFHLVTFLEVAGLVGPLPVTRVAGAFAGGIRATF